jgi:hypothetical protein
MTDPTSDPFPPYEELLDMLVAIGVNEYRFEEEVAHRMAIEACMAHACVPSHDADPRTWLAAAVRLASARLQPSRARE